MNAEIYNFSSTGKSLVVARINLALKDRVVK